jgi:hypothetical protein
MSIHLDVIIANLEIDHLVFLSTNAELNDTNLASLVTNWIGLDMLAEIRFELNCPHKIKELGGQRPKQQQSATAIHPRITANI